MFGIEFFFKSAAAGMKLAQKTVENMFNMVDFYAGLSGQPCSKKKGAEPLKKEEKKETPVTSQTTEMRRPQKPPEPLPVKQPPEKAAPVHPVQKDEVSQPIKKMTPEPPAKAHQTATVSSKNSTPPSKKASVPKTGAGSEKKDMSSPKKKSVPAIDAVNTFIAKQNQGVTTEDIMKATGFPRKKIQNIIYKLKKRGKIKSPAKGLYISR
ncbi:MAG: hypothetical protein R6U27_03965 [Desulfobacterales bacterium]